MDFSCKRGFIDAHVHLRDIACLKDVHAAGITGVRDAGTEQGAGLGILPRAVGADMPMVVSAGKALFKKGGYGARLGIPIDSLIDAKQAVHSLKKAGACVIKVMASGVVSLTAPGKITSGGFNREEISFIKNEAANLGLGIMAHANGEQAILDAADAGVVSIEHGFFMTLRALDVILAKGIFWVPTVGALQRAADAEGISEAARFYVAGLVRDHLDLISNAYRMGVLLAIGTDSVLPDPRYADHYRAELEYFAKAGIRVDEINRIACANGKRLLGM